MLYNYLKLFHILAVVIFLGNIITGIFWMRIAVHSKDPKIINHTMNGIIKSDRIFTFPGIIFIVTAGLFAAIRGHFPILRSGWILWSLILFTLSGIFYMWKVGPLQKKISLYTSPPGTAQGFNDAVFNSMYQQWEAWGIAALVTPLGALVMMVLKLPG